jgi:integrase
MRESNRLSAALVANKRTPGLYGDGDGLWLRVAEGGSKSWVFRFKRDGRERQMGLGSLRTWSLAEARERARECRQLLDLRKDPIEHRRAEHAKVKEEAARAITFQQCAELYISSHGDTWKNAKHAAQWSSTLKIHAYRAIGGLPVSTIDTALVLKVVEPIWRKTPETANRVRGRIENILDWATVRGHRAGDNPARWRGHLQKMLPARGKLAPVKHHPALPYSDLSDFISEVRKREGTAPRALEFTILTASRTNEVIGARWPEIDFSTKTWSVPASRMKAGREHKVPLSARAIELLTELPREGNPVGYVFLGARANEPLSNMAMLETLRRMGRDDLTVHGFRATFKTWASECTNFPREVVEAALAHILGDKVEAAYQRGDLFQKRAALMQTWAKYCRRPPVANDATVAAQKIVPIRRSI